MSQVAEDFSWITDSRKFFRRLLNHCLDKISGIGGAVLLLSPDTGELETEAFRGKIFSPTSSNREWEKLADWVVRADRPARINFNLSVKNSSAAYIALPLNVDGQVVGVICLQGSRKVGLNESQEKELEDFLTRESQHLKTVWMIDHLRNESTALQSLLKVERAIASQNVLENVLQQVAQETCKLMKARLCSIMLLSDDQQQLELKASHGASRAYRGKPNLHVNESLVGVVIKKQKPLSILDVRQHQRYQHTELAKREKLVSLLAVPLVFDGKALGVLVVYTLEQHRFSNSEIRLLSAVADMASIVITKAVFLKKVVAVEESLKATERLSALGWLAAEVAHEIRNPLTVMQMVFHSMIQSLPLDAESSKDAQLIQTKMGQMNRIVEQVLTFAKSAEPVFEEIDPKILIEDLILLIRHKLTEQKIVLRKSIAGNIKSVLGDRAQIEQTILNLVLNACHAMQKGGVLTISVTHARSQNVDWVVFGVKDTGAGIPLEKQKDIFQPFFTHRPTGTGLGLALVRKTAELHKGHVKFKSVPGKGTLFQFYIPVGQKPTIT